MSLNPHLMTYIMTYYMSCLYVIEKSRFTDVIRQRVVLIEQRGAVEACSWAHNLMNTKTEVVLYRN